MSAIDDDDEMLLGLAFRTQGTMVENVITGSTARDPQAHIYPPEGLSLFFIFIIDGSLVIC